MAGTGYGKMQGKERADPVESADAAVRVLIWLLIGAILLIILVTVVSLAATLISVLAGATTLLALGAFAVSGMLWYRLRALDERLRALESR